MSQHGASLQNTNNELVRCIEEMYQQREEVTEQIRREEEDRNRVQNDIRILTERLNRLNESLGRKLKAKQEYDRTIGETEAAYGKILESSQTLLQVLKRESSALKKATV